MSSENTAVDILNRFEELARQYAPEIMNTAANVVWVNAIRNILCGVYAILFLIMALKLCAWGCQWLEKRHQTLPEANADDIKIATYTIRTVTGVFIFFCLITIFGNLLDTWNWVALVKPHLALAHQVLGLR